MSWALFAQLYALFEWNINPTQRMTPSLILSFVTIGLLSYMLKDRIKDNTGRWLKSKANTVLSERSFLYRRTSKSQPLCRIQEDVDFCTIDDVPIEIQQTFNNLNHTDISVISGGDVLTFKKQIQIKNSNIKTQAPWSIGIRDIHRLHLQQWCRTFADHKMKIDLLNDENAVVSKNTRRIYEVYFAVELHDSSEKTLSFGKIQLTKRGIRKVIEL